MKKAPRFGSGPLAVAGLAFMSISASIRSAEALSFSIVNVPGALGTAPRDINNNGIIVGEYAAVRDNTSRGFVYDGANYLTFDVFGSTFTAATGINDSGVIVGRYRDANGKFHGFLKNGSVITSLDVAVPDTAETFARGINNAGEVVGGFRDTRGYIHGFLYSGGSYQTLDFGAGIFTEATGINDRGEIVGLYDTGQFQGFLLDPGWSTLTVPGASYTVPWGINNNGDVVGDSQYPPVGGVQPRHGFVYSGGAFTAVDYPGVPTGTFALGTNDRGDIVGGYQDSSGEYAVTRGFVALNNTAVVPEPATLLLLGTGAAVVAVRRRVTKVLDSKPPQRCR